MASRSNEKGGGNQAPSGPVNLGSAEIRSLLSPTSLLHHIQTSLGSLSESICSPHRPHFAVDETSSLILMPAWSHHPSLPYIGVKVLTSFPRNSALGLPSVHASYLLFDSATGSPLASLDGTELTLHRTAAISALAAKSLAREDARILSVVGTGALAPYIIKAHLAALPSLQRIILWNRTAERARELVARLEEEGLGNVNFDHRECLDEAVQMGDVIACASRSDYPLVKGKHLKKGTHLGLIGSFKPSMRECDDEAIRRGKVYVDCEEALEEAGELVGAIQRGIIERGDVGLLVDLIKEARDGRTSDAEITVFKSVGFAVLDILAAQLAYEKHMED
ncbi:protein SAR DEFICIENT 4 isoform X2 [Aristolochia californica]|uniref:protein SAR DEFICIENT 4 isoform X2 n=1 Tax=Aristolochia californica TaxID=171875 RepID=UPI0035D92B22